MIYHHPHPLAFAPLLPSPAPWSDYAPADDPWFTPQPFDAAEWRRIVRANRRRSFDRRVRRHVRYMARARACWWTFGPAWRLWMRRGQLAFTCATVAEIREAEGGGGETLFRRVR